jgi:hypothetical protein
VQNFPSAEVYKYGAGFSDRLVLLDTCVGGSLFQDRNLFYFIESSHAPMIVIGVNPKGRPLVITECGIANILPLIHLVTLWIPVNLLYIIVDMTVM